MAGPRGAVDDEVEAGAADLEDVDEDEDEDDEDEELEGSADGDAFQNLEERLTKTVSKRISEYMAKQETRLAKYRDRQHTWRQRRLDEFALKNIGTAQIQNPEAVAESIERQVQAAEARLAQLQEMRNKLASVTAEQNAAS